jgi:hypothetical protein
VLKEIAPALVSGDIPSIPNRRDRRQGWETFELARAKFIREKIRSEVNFQHYRALHQIVGGIYPPRTVPIKGGASAWLVIANRDHSTFVIEGTNLTDKERPFTAVLTATEGVERIELSIPPGDFRVAVASTLAKQLPRALFTVELQGGRSSTPVIRLHRVAFE